MIELERHIEILLLDNDCVIVPGLGGFIAHHVEACYDDRDDMFLPPKRMLGFNPKLNMNDSLLAQSYVEAYDISYPEALIKIDAEVDELKQTIEKNGFYELSNVGVLLLNSDGNLEFEPCESGVLTPETYGLSGFEVRKVRRDSQVKSSILEHSQELETFALGTRNAATVAVSNEREHTPFFVGNASESVKATSGDSDKTISIKVSVLRNVFAVACAIVAFFVLATPISTDVYENGKKISSFSGGLLYNLVPKDGYACSLNTNNVGVGSNAVTPHIVRPLKEQKKDCTPSSNALKTIVNTDSCKAKATKDYYCIVLAARITKSNANAFVDKLHSNGLSEARVLDEKGESLKVVYGAYDTEANAFSELNELRDNEIFEDCWVYHVK